MLKIEKIPNLKNHKLKKHYDFQKGNYNYLIGNNILIAEPISAEEMFEKLGYKQIENNVNYISYKYEFSDGSSIYSTIRFYLHQQDIEFYYNDKILNNIGVEELQAINQQVKELGWLDEK